MDHPLARSLIGTIPTNLGNGTICMPAGGCYCEGWQKSRGTSTEKKIAIALQWSTFAISVASLIWYAYQSWKATVGWEEVYVALIEMIKYIIEAFHEFDSPATLWLSSGNPVVWLRYGEWLLTCPVILIHLSNMTGLKDDYNKRTMGLLVSDIGCIVWGATSAMCVGWLKIIFYLISLAYGVYTYFHAAKVYIEAFHTVPKGICRDLVRVLAWTYFCSWGMFPVLFVLGPEGFGHISQYSSAIAHTILDLVAKNMWGFMGNQLRVKIHEHILLHGDIRKKQKINVAGQQMEVETLVAEEDEETIKQPTSKYASRESFIVMRDRLKEKGFEVRASLDGTGSNDREHYTGAKGDGHGGGGGGAPVMAFPQAAGGGGKPGLELSKLGSSSGFGGSFGAGAGLEPGRVILAVPDISMIDFFREQFAQLMVPYEVVPALGVDNTLALVQQAAALGGCDFVLMHPEFLRDCGSTGLLPRLKMMGQRTAAFGWSQIGPMRDLIEGSGVDAWLEGPSFGSGVSLGALQQLVARMQAAKRNAAAAGSMMGGMGGMGGGFGGVNGMGGNGSVSMGGGMGMGGMMGGGGMGMGGGGNSSGTFNLVAMAGSGALQQQMSGNGLTGMYSQPQQPMLMQQAPQPSLVAGSGPSRVGTNPLFGSAPSPLNSQPGLSPTGLTSGQLPGLQLSPMAGVAPTPAAPGGGGNASEAEMLNQLMAEINRLKNELGE